MPVTMDEEGRGLRKLREFYEFSGKRVLEIGCGEGRMTYPFAELANHITAIDPRGEDVQTAVLNTPEHLAGKIHFIPIGVEEFVLPEGDQLYDLCLFTWSL
jgi:2-polyprenyl-3-methyl-5-hydroxy-6-metoxy-1,4-benzoquinol methylase